MGLVGALLGRRGTGYLVDRADPRDWPLGALPALAADVAASETASIRQAHIIRPKNQRSTNACTGAAFAHIIWSAALAAGLDFAEPSLLFPYFLGRAVWGGERVDLGSFLRTTGQALRKHGICPETEWPFSLGRVNRKPSWQALRAAHATRTELQAMYRIPDGDADGVRNALRRGYGVVGGFLVNRGFQADHGNSIIDEQEAPFIGGHALGIDGFEADRFGIVNSYGPGWREGGYADVTEAFVRRGRDFWALKVGEP